MNKLQNLTLVAVVLCIGMFLTPGQAQAYMVGNNWTDFRHMAGQAQGILDDMMQEFVNCNLWSTNCNGQTAIWSTVVGQRGPGWVPVGSHTADHGAGRWSVEQTFVRADYHWDFLAEVLKPDACLDGVPPARVGEIRNAFNHNKNRVLSTEITVYGVRVRASVLGCSNDHTRNVTTGGSISMGIKAGTPFCPTVYTVNENIPSLFGAAHGGPMLNEAHPHLRDLLANMTAAYMTIGDSRVVNYWYAFMGRIGLTFVSELLPGLISDIGKSDPYEERNPADYMLDAISDALREITLIPDKSDKANCPPWGNVPGVDETFSVSVPVVGNVNIRVSIASSNICLTLTNFADKFNCSSFQCMPEYLGLKETQGDLNGDGTRNIASWFGSGANLQEWKVLEGAGGYLDLITHPVAPAAPVNFGATHHFSVGATSSAPISYQWYAGFDQNNLTAVPNATSDDFAAEIDFYSYDGIETVKYYRADVSAFFCGAAQTIQSQVVPVVGGTPPSILIYEHPEGGNFLPGATVSLSVEASSQAGPGLRYQWQKYNTSTSAWENVDGAEDAVLLLPLIMPVDAGQYRVEIFNEVPPSPEYSRLSNAATVNVAPVIDINPQPLGAEIELGDDYTLVIGATVTHGVLEFRWQRDTGFGYTNLTGWGSQTIWDIVDAGIIDAGTYRCQVRNTLAPYGTYQVNSDAASVSISSGIVFRVDKSAPGPVQDGLSWETAFTTIQPAIDAAFDEGGGEVWVAGGPLGAPVVYNEERTVEWGGRILAGGPEPGRVTGSLVMPSNVGLYGGFEGWRGGAGAREQYRQQRVIAQNRTVIDGSVARAGAPAYHVVVFGRWGIPATNTTLDGFVITGGDAAGISDDYHSWRGGGIYNWQSAPTIANCYIEGNHAAVAGGGIANEGGGNGSGAATIVNCVIQNNHVSRAADDYYVAEQPPIRDVAPNPLRGGAGIFTNRSNPTLRFVTIRDNTQDAYTLPVIGPFDDENEWGIGAGGILSWAHDNGDVLLTNSIVWANDVANDEGGIQFGRTELSVDTFTATYSNIENGWTGAGSHNSAADPELDADSVPLPGSPVINDGDPSVLDGEDIRGVPRPIDGVVDRGAVEVSTNGPVPACYETWLDFILTPQITDISEVYNANDTVSEVPIWKVQLQNKTFGCNDIPESTITVTVTDILGRTGSCDADVTVTESEPPTAVLNDNPEHATIELQANGVYALSEDDKEALGGASYDNCFVTDVRVVPSLFGCSQVDKNVFVTLIVSDASGNSSSVMTPLYIHDVTPPKAECGIIDVALNALGAYELTQADLQALGAGSTDACGIAWGLTTADISELSCAHVGPLSVELTIWDNHGNYDTCLATVNVLDVTPPTLYGVSARNFMRYEGDYTLAKALEDVAAEDVCSGDITDTISVAAYDAAENPVAFPIPADFDTGGAFQYDFKLVYSVQDDSGNESTVDTILTLYQTALPEITVQEPLHVVLECGDEYVDPGATAIDPATGTDITEQIQTVITVDKDRPGDDYEVNYFILVEGYGVYVHEQRTVEVVNTLKPVITLHGEAVMGVQRGATFTDPGFIAWDHCYGDLTDEVVVTGFVDANTYGDYELTYTVSDGVHDADPQTRLVHVGDLFEFLQHPEGARLYTTDAAYDLDAVYINGWDVSEHQWFRDEQGLSAEPPELTGNTVTLTIDPATHAHGAFNYRLQVYDNLGTHSSNSAVIEVQPPLSADLADIELIEGDAYHWKLTVTGGLSSSHDHAYQWYRLDETDKGWTPLHDGHYPDPVAGPGKFAGTDTATLTFDPYTEAMAGQYQVEVSDDFTTVLAGPATLSHSQGIPAASGVALAALAFAGALGGALGLRKRRRV